ncbi:MAG: hypothetical protein JKY54_00360, partial [Flavobacteriales bacterium]|nr:hypothetical protein [Flavobacteriales bacterium]
IVITIIISFSIIGIWHGARWTFLWFGLIQAAVLALEILSKRKREVLIKKLPRPITRLTGILFTFVIFTFSCLFFKASSTDQVWDWFGSSAINTNLIGFTGWLEGFHQQVILFSLIAFILVDHGLLKKGFTNWCSQQNGVVRWLVYGILLYAVLAGSPIKVEPFIYEAF